MSCTVAADSPARTLQSQIDVLQRELYEGVTKLFADGNVKKNTYYTDRHKVITEAIRNGQLPRTFWADAIIAALQTPEPLTDNNNNNDNNENDMNDRLIGPYDAQLLREYLEDMRVVYTDVGVRVVLQFKPNPFFEETELWGEEQQHGAVKCHSHGDDCGCEKKEENNNSNDDNNGNNNKDGEEEEDERDDGNCYFSGITWKPGHGPIMDDDDDNNNDNNSNNKDGERKRPRTSTDAASTPTRGWSFLDVFSKMLPHPADDEAFDEEDEEDDEDFEEAVEKWETEMEDRRELLMLLVEDVWMDPVAAYTKGKKNGMKTATTTEESDPAAQRVRTE
ncbi:hypothetical protein LSM04_002538 [Trypanosoma melophagium]|uniref:uncharacterized protein n=1 Tax=Trypanosoma melophagium TaxID=715481 RepID=UPI00351A17E8|nr:hypothetical protein LSM04_002538 [Trypanosoma melophagium]